MSKANATTPIYISLALVSVGIVLGLIGGVLSGSILGGVIAGLGVIPAAYGTWTGMQQETQTSMVGAVGMVFLSLGTGAVLIILGIIDKLR